MTIPDKIWFQTQYHHHIHPRGFLCKNLHQLHIKVAKYLFFLLILQYLFKVILKISNAVTQLIIDFKLLIPNWLQVLLVPACLLQRPGPDLWGQPRCLTTWGWGGQPRCLILWVFGHPSMPSWARRFISIVTSHYHKDTQTSTLSR